jgi:hypothetical protein
MAPSASRDLDRIFKYVFAISPVGARSLKNSILDQIASLMFFSAPDGYGGATILAGDPLHSNRELHHLFQCSRGKPDHSDPSGHHGARKPPRRFS